MVRECAEERSDTAFMVENVVVNSRVRSDARVQSEKLGAEFQTVNVQSLGHSQRRVRRITTNIIADLRKLEQKSQMDVNVLLAPLGLCTEEAIPCVMASEPNTHSPGKL